MKPVKTYAARVFTALVTLAAVAMGPGLNGGSPAQAGTLEGNDEIHASFGDSNTEMWLYWHGPDAQVNYGQTAGYSDRAQGVAPTIQPVDSAGPFWRAKLTSLTPGSTYHYQIGAGGADHTFQTAPTGDFVWNDIGDTGTTYYNPSSPQGCNKPWMADVWQQIAGEHPAFITHGGDISYANDCGVPNVHQFWNDISSLSTQAALQFTWGNHEYGPATSTAPAGTPADSMANYKGRFMSPNPQTVPVDTPSRTTSPGCPSAIGTNGCLGDDWGYFTAGHVLFISQPEPWTTAYADWKTKADALMASAENDPNVYFIVTYGHRPTYSSQTTNAGNADLQAAVNALGDTYSPTARPDGKYVLNIGHHVHSGEAFAPTHGVVNVVNGGGGSEQISGLTATTGSLWRTTHFEHMRGTVTGPAMKLEFICGPVYTYNPPGMPVRRATCSTRPP